MKELLELAMSMNVKHEVQYSDYRENDWTVPLFIHPETIKRLTTDNSVMKIRLTFSDCEVIIDPKSF